MVKQNEKVLSSLKTALDEGAEKLRDTAKEAAEKAGEATKAAGNKAKAAGKTAKAVAGRAGRKGKEEAEQKPEADKADVKEAKTAGRKKKAAEKKPAAKKEAGVSKNLKTKMVFQFFGNNVDADEVLKKATRAAQKQCADRQVKSLEVYINGHENAAYYVINGEAKSEYRIEL